MKTDVRREKELEIKKTILIVEDDEINGDILASFLEHDFYLLRAYNGKECLEILNRDDRMIDLVLLDIFMPIMNGYEVLHERQYNPKLKRIPFIVMTAEAKIEEECFHLGVNDFIKKPYDNPDIIVARIKRMIELYEDRSIIKEVKRDKLTNLYSMEFFKKYCAQFNLRHPKIKKDLLAINITRFHLLNELYGRDYADEILKDIADSIKNFVRQNEGIAARASGDNFYIYCHHQDDYSEFFNNVIEHVKGLTHVNIVHVRVGIYPNVNPNMDIDIVIGRAMAASLIVKEDVNKIFAVYDESSEEQVHFNEHLINSFEDSIKNKDFKVFFQPKYNIQGERNRLASAEALVRWFHPKYGMISPGIFIPLFEKNGLIQELDKFVFNEVAEKMKEWKEKFGAYIPVSVNVSRVDIYNTNLEEDILEAFDSRNVPHKYCYIEITESAYSTGEDIIIKLCSSLREKGFVIEIDDFGTGYSTLHSLLDIPFDVLKLDMMFIRKLDQNIKNAHIIQMILNLCREIGVMSVAEGVETERHYNFLKEAGCDIIQGYYFSKPLPENEFAELLVKELKK
ncbi:MAG: EAL domain-containing protein [Bacilli bacterium]|nr:EAL domain-containing protein [Bacilli bacterium]